MLFRRHVGDFNLRNLTRALRQVAEDLRSLWSLGMVPRDESAQILGGTQSEGQPGVSSSKTRAWRRGSQGAQETREPESNVRAKDRRERRECGRRGT